MIKQHRISRILTSLMFISLLSCPLLLTYACNINANAENASTSKEINNSVDATSSIISTDDNNIASDKDNVVAANQPGVSIYITKPISSQKILPDTPPSLFPLVGTETKNTINVKACRGEFEPASFVIRPNQDMTNVSISATDLIDQNNSSIPKSAIDIRLVKCWYQAGSTSVLKDRKTLVPELLLKDDKLVKVDLGNQTNQLKVKINGIDQYIDISSPNAIFPINAKIYDASDLLPFDAQANTNKQVWITFHIPNDAMPGDYTGVISLKNGSQELHKLGITLTVLPFELQQPAIDYGLYYNAQLVRNETGFHSHFKSENQYRIELLNMKNHGVIYPVLSQGFDSMLGRALTIRNEVGLPADKLFIFFTPLWQRVTDLNHLSDELIKWKQFVAQYGYSQLYAYAIDEAKGDVLLSQRPAWQVAHSVGVGIYVACYKGAVDLVGDLLDLPILSGPFNPQEVAKWHKQGKKVFSYGNPQVGVEDPEIYRRNYGIALLCNGYDGAMDYVYQGSFETNNGFVWNDFKNTTAYRNHVFAYPTSDGVIDTIQWEGFREAVDDVRYLTTFAKASGSSAYPDICGTLTLNNDLNSIRQIIINRILSLTTGS